MMYYNPAGRTPTKNFQLGHFTTGQAADDKFITGNNPEAAASAVFANYLQLNNKLNLFSSLIPSTVLSSTNLDKVLMFG